MVFAHTAVLSARASTDTVTGMHFRQHKRWRTTFRLVHRASSLVINALINARVGPWSMGRSMAMEYRYSHIPVGNTGKPVQYWYCSGNIEGKGGGNARYSTGARYIPSPLNIQILRTCFKDLEVLSLHGVCLSLGLVAIAPWGRQRMRAERSLDACVCSNASSDRLLDAGHNSASHAPPCLHWLNLHRSYPVSDGTRGRLPADRNIGRATKRMSAGWPPPPLPLPHLVPAPTSAAAGRSYVPVALFVSTATQTHAPECVQGAG